jgi:RNA recognition motif-containing protein
MPYWRLTPPRTSDSSPRGYAPQLQRSDSHDAYDNKQDTGECKGFAFVEFYSLEYSQYFMSAFGECWYLSDLHNITALLICCWLLAGSAGDMNAPQLIVENRAVTLEYARDSVSSGQQAGRGGGEGRGDPQSKSDWLCDTVSTVLPITTYPCGCRFSCAVWMPELCS